MQNILSTKNSLKASKTASESKFKIEGVCIKPLTFSGEIWMCRCNRWKNKLHLLSASHNTSLSVGKQTSRLSQSTKNGL